jgi:hypothetical protein
MTLGDLLLIFAAADFAVSVILAMALVRRQAELPADRRGPAPQLVIGGGFVAALILCVLALYLPEADRVIL